MENINADYNRRTLKIQAKLFNIRKIITGSFRIESFGYFLSRLEKQINEKWFLSVIPLQ